jgi:hypothetical protein
MSPREFCYWLQGHFELEGNALGTLDVVKTRMIKDHLNLVFLHSIDDEDPTGVKQATHDGKKLLTEDDKVELEKKIAQAAKTGGKFGGGLARC